MRIKIAFLFCAASISSIGMAQNLVTVRQDTTFPVELRHTINTSSARVGDPVEFRMLEPTLVGQGIVAPYNATLAGRIEKVRARSSSSPKSSVSIRVHTLRWNRNEIPVNLVVSGIYSVRSPIFSGYPEGLRPTFLEGIQILAHLSGEAFTEFTSSKKEVVLRHGILLMLRQINPDNYRTMVQADQTGQQTADVKVDRPFILFR